VHKLDNTHTAETSEKVPHTKCQQSAVALIGATKKSRIRILSRPKLNQYSLYQMCTSYQNLRNPQTILSTE